MIQTYGKANIFQKVGRMVQRKRGWVSIGIPLPSRHEEEQ